MMPILYLLGGIAQLLVAAAVAKDGLEDWRVKQDSPALSFIIAALFTLCAFLMLIQVQP